LEEGVEFRKALKALLPLNKTNPHHKFGCAHTTRDSQHVSKVMAAMDNNPFMTKRSDLMKVVTSEYADPDVKN